MPSANLTPVYSPFPFKPKRGSNAILWDEQGKKVIDFTSGIAVTPLGHANLELNEVLKQQSENFWHVSNLLESKPVVELANLLTEISFADQVLFANSGTESNEAAIKLAINFANETKSLDASKINIICCTGAFHGRTFAALAATDNAGKNRHFDIGIDCFRRVPFNDPIALKEAFDEHTVAMMVEPIQGESGLHASNRQFLAAARELCTSFGACLIFDEIQSGLGRCGSMFAYQQYQIEPDIMTLSKGIANGIPLGAILSKKSISSAMKVGSHGSTFAGNPLACAVAKKTIELINEPGFLDQVNQKSNYLEKQLNQIVASIHYPNKARVHGLWSVIDLPDSLVNERQNIINYCLQQGVLVIAAGAKSLRLAPALTIEMEVLKEGLEILSQSLASFKASKH